MRPGTLYLKAKVEPDYQCDLRNGKNRQENLQVHATSVTLVHRAA